MIISRLVEDMDNQTFYGFVQTVYAYRLYVKADAPHATKELKS